MSYRLAGLTLGGTVTGDPVKVISGEVVTGRVA